MVRIEYINAKWAGEIKLGKEVLEYFKKQKITSVALFASSQFTELDSVKSQLKNLGISVNITKAKRTDGGVQILGCDCYADSFERPIIQKSEVILYVGDGLFHPKALLLSQINFKEIKPVLIWDCVAEKMSILTEKEIKIQINKMKRNLRIYINSFKIGILVTTKPGQQYINLALRLKEVLKKQGKKAFIFTDNTFDLKQLENYPFIECWVNTACPRIGTDDITTTEKALINIRDAFAPATALEMISK
ncbi:diphthamide synthesis protein [Candidatus Pacearchaeota archaeon]|nr:diphthamide synthesis protein [Candidatus Pacearchaeota archaeon]